jgi:hypothetical protein
MAPGDFDGDGKGDISVWRDTTGAWYRLNSSDGTFQAYFFGTTGDEPVARDYDGDGKTDMVITRNLNIGVIPATWYFRYSSGLPDAQFNFGLGGLDVGAPGDYDGDGLTDVTVYRRAEENNFYVLRSTDSTMQVMHWGVGDTGTACFVACDVPVASYNSL